MLLWTIIVIVVLVLMYAVVPVIWTRTMRQSAFHKTGRPGTVSLTFDDGPHPTYTPRLLDVLRDSGIRATFFVLANEAKRYPEIIRRMVREGHEVQVHGLKHWFVPLLPPHLTRQQCIGAKDALESTFGIRCNVYRPTWGACNLASLWWARVANMKLCTWSVMIGDWRRVDPQELLNRIEKKLSDEAIIVLHDSDVTPGAEKGAPESVIEMIPALAQQIQAREWKWICISDCL